MTTAKKKTDEPELTDPETTDATGSDPLQVDDGPAGDEPADDYGYAGDEPADDYGYVAVIRGQASTRVHKTTELAFEDADAAGDPDAYLIPVVQRAADDSS